MLVKALAPPGPPDSLACVRAAFLSPLGDLFDQLKLRLHCDVTAACFSPTHLGLSQTTYMDQSKMQGKRGEKRSSGQPMGSGLGFRSSSGSRCQALLRRPGPDTTSWSQRSHTGPQLAVCDGSLALHGSVNSQIALTRSRSRAKGRSFSRY